VGASARALEGSWGAGGDGRILLSPLLASSIALSRTQTVLRLVFDESGAIGLVRWVDSFELDVV
jgi:hypothetical protein